MSRANSINNIEKWILAQLSVIGRKGSSVLELKIDVPIPPQLAGWQMYTTSGNENDCMIHALLTDCSPTFRTLEIDTKNTIASIYRRGDGRSNAPFLQIVLDYYTKYPNIPVNEGGRSANLVGQARIDFLTELITGNEFLRQEFLTPICDYYKINVLIYATNRPGEARRRAIDSKVIFEFEPQPDLIENAPTIVMHNGYSIHFSAMSQTDGKTFIMPYKKVVEIKDEMDELIKKEQPKATLKCIYKDGNIFYDNSGKQWIVQDITYTSGYGDLNCIALRIQNFETSEVLNNVPLNFFQKISNDDLRFDKTSYDASIRTGIPPLNPSSKPLKSSPQKRPVSIPDLLPKSTLTPDKELSDYFESGKLKPEFNIDTGFAETLGPTRNDPATPKTGSFWEGKIIEIIDALKKQRQTALAPYNNDNPIFNNYSEFQKLQLDNTGKVIIPAIDEDRVRDYTNSEQEFNKIIKALQDRIEEIKRVKKDFDEAFLSNNNQLNILSSMLNYPQDSNLENYFLLPDILEERDLNRIWNTYIASSVKVKVNRRNFISLLVLLSRNAKDGYITTNKWKDLYSSLLKVFRETDETNYPDISGIILIVFQEFFRVNGDSIPFVVNKILSGEEMYKIYQTSYKPDNKTSLTKEIIGKRTQVWLETSIEKTRTTPTIFIFDKYTEEQIKFMIQENSVCKEISELTGKLGKTNIPQMQLPTDFFVKPSSGTDKLSSFLEETGPNVTKSIQNDRRRMFFEGRGPYVRGGERKTKNVKKMQKKRKTRRKRM